MVKTASIMVELGTAAPHFSLIDVTTDTLVSLSATKPSKATVVFFICNHCPFVKHINKGIVALAETYLPKDVQFFAINSNDVSAYPKDSPEHMRSVAQEQHYPFPYLFDATQEVARAYHAVCTPDFFVYDAELKLQYRGQLDDSRPGNDVPVTGQSIGDALDCILNARPVSLQQIPSIGCNIKWRELA